MPLSLSLLPLSQDFMASDLLRGGQVLNVCYHTISSVVFGNTNSDGWAGSIELSTDGAP